MVCCLIRHIVFVCSWERERTIRASAQILITKGPPSLSHHACSVASVYYYCTKERVRTHAAAKVYGLLSETLPFGGALYTLDKLMHFLPQLSDFVPLTNGSYSSRAQTD